LQNAELKHKTVHVILTCASASDAEKYKGTAVKALASADCLPGNVHVFITGKNLIDAETLNAQLTEIFIPDEMLQSDTEGAQP
jgi:hypothetical protein